MKSLSLGYNLIHRPLSTTKTIFYEFSTNVQIRGLLHIKIYSLHECLLWCWRFSQVYSYFNRTPPLLFSCPPLAKHTVSLCLPCGCVTPKFVKLLSRADMSMGQCNTPSHQIPIIFLIRPILMISPQQIAQPLQRNFINTCSSL